jgi:NAD+ synthase (glutamine-hydrolysing)
LRYGDAPNKIQYLAERAFAGTYDSKEIAKWFDVFQKRFRANQFKRENQPNGPKVGSVSLSPRGDWRCPPE